MYWLARAEMLSPLHLAVLQKQTRVMRVESTLQPLGMFCIVGSVTVIQPLWITETQAFSLYNALVIHQFWHLWNNCKTQLPYSPKNNFIIYFSTSLFTSYQLHFHLKATSFFTSKQLHSSPQSNFLIPVALTSQLTHITANLKTWQFTQQLTWQLTWQFTWQLTWQLTWQFTW